MLEPVHRDGECPYQLAGGSVASPNRTCQYTIDPEQCLVDRECLTRKLVGTTMIAGRCAQVRPLAKDLLQACSPARFACQRGRLAVAELGLLVRPAGDGPAPVPEELVLAAARIEKGDFAARVPALAGIDVH